MFDGHEPQFDQLSRGMIELAEKLVRELGGFAPFGACLNEEGKVVQLDATEIEEPQDAIDCLAEAIRGFGSPIGVIVVDTHITDAKTSERSDCIMLIGEHRSGVALRGFLPYAKDGDDVSFGDHFVEAAEPLIYRTS